MPILFAITLASEMAVLYGYVTLSFVVLLTTIGTPVLWKTFSFFQKFVSKFQVIVTSSNANAKNVYYRLFFRRIYPVSFDFKMNPLRESVFLVFR